LLPTVKLPLVPPVQVAAQTPLDINKNAALLKLPLNSVLQKQRLNKQICVAALNLKRHSNKPLIRKHVQSDSRHALSLKQECNVALQELIEGIMSTALTLFVPLLGLT